jgi:hypothetical protein
MERNCDFFITNSGRLSLVAGIFDPLPDTKRLVVDGFAELNVESGSVIFDSPNQIAGAGTLKIMGSGTVEIGEGQGDFAANINLSGGELIVSGSITGSVQGSAGTIISGTGRMGQLELIQGGTVSPGSSSAGSLTVDGISLASNATAQFGLSGVVPVDEYDQIVVAGDVNLGGGNLALTSTILPALFTDVFYLILNDGADAVVGAFGLLSGTTTDLYHGAVFESGGVNYQISYTAESGIGFEGVGNDVAIRSVPEPTASLLIAGTLFVGMTTRRRRASRL